MTTEQTNIASASWVILWSKSQCATHVEPLMDMLASNLQAYQCDRRMDYVPLAIGTEAECRRVAAEMRPAMRERQNQRQGNQ